MRRVGLGVWSWLRKLFWKCGLGMGIGVWGNFWFGLVGGSGGR